MNRTFQLFPDAASRMSHQVDHLFWYLMLWSALLTVGVAGLILTFAVRYRARPGHRQGFLGPHHALEWTWTFATLAIFLSFFFWGADLYIGESAAPAGAMEIHVVGKQWMWKIQHPEGRREINELHVPVNRPVKLILASQDVIHGFYVPAFRIKQDVVPGRYANTWFQPTRPGTYHLFCSQYCGTEHSAMTGTVYVLEPADYAAWLAGMPTAVSEVQAGAQLFVQYSCHTCHGQQAPTLAGLYMSRVPLSDGSTVLADEAYLRESILYPAAKIVAGYPPIMPSYHNQLSEEQLFALIAYIKALRGASATQPATTPPGLVGEPPTTNPTGNPITNPQGIP